MSFLPLIKSRRAVILPVVLMVIVLLALLGATFSFRIHADNASTQAIANRMQSRLAAEAGVEWVKLLLRTARDERSVWYHNPVAFNRVILWAHDEDSKTSGTNDKLDEEMAYRFSIVGDDFSDDEMYTRFGIVDEASKINLNTATDAQILKLVQAAAGGDEAIDAKEIANAILDWRDSDNKPRSESGGTEGEYYKNLAKPYIVKNGVFDTVEELLLVKGVTANLLYGEDYDRNGLLTENEDDGDETFPPDNEDGLLNRGMYPYLTVLSYETQNAMDNRPRVSLLGDEVALRNTLEEAFPDEPSVVSFCVDATRPTTNTGKSGNQQNQGGGNQGGGQGSQGQGGSGGKPKGGASLLPRGFNPFLDTDIDGAKTLAHAQRRPKDPPGEPDKTEQTIGEGDAALQGSDPESSAGTGTADQQGNENQDNSGDPGNTGNQGENQPQSSDAVNPSSPIRSPAYLLFPRTIGEAVVQSPVGLEHLPALMDLTTVSPAKTREVVGLVNINTAPRLVLSLLDGLTSDQVDAIVAEREGLDDEVLATTAWLVTEEILDNETYAKIAPQITARAQQFKIQSIGYADHIGTVTRLEVIVDMNGPIAETIYYRDISYLGAPFPIREEDREEQNGR